MLLTLNSVNELKITLPPQSVISGSLIGAASREQMAPIDQQQESGGIAFKQMKTNYLLPFMCTTDNNIQENYME